MPKKPDDIEEPASTSSVDDRASRATTLTQANAAANAACTSPVITYEDLVGKNQHGRLIFMRSKYNASLAACSAASNSSDQTLDAIAGFEQALISINDGLVDIEDGIPTSAAQLFTTFYGSQTDKLDPRTRRSVPWGTVICDIAGYEDGIPISTTPKNFDVNTPEDIVDPGEEFEPSEETEDADSIGITRPFINFANAGEKDGYSEKHESCLTDLRCTYEEFKDPIVKPEKVEIPDTVFDVKILDKDITTGCANGDGLFDKLMTAIDSSINLQYKSNRLDNKTFGQFYAATISSAMQQTTQFLIQKEQLKLDAAKTALEYDRFHHDKDKRKYETELIKAQVSKALLEVTLFKKQAPLELNKLTQETKTAEKNVELTTRQIEEVKATIVGMYNAIGEGNATGKYQRQKLKVDIDKAEKDIDELTLNGVLDRNLTKAKVGQAVAGIKTAKFDAILKKYQAYSTKVAIAESKATGASSRRLTAADIQSKNKQASLYDQQRRTYIHGQRAEVLNIMKDMWNVQIDTLGPEGMAIEAIKGPEFSSRLERAALDVGA